MNTELKKEAHILCQRIRELTTQIEKKIEKKIENASQSSPFLSQNQEKDFFTDHQLVRK
tara:strand:- start:498 stop:674 length:177 start_codon:yes stop_codon:yes gene_type:complete